MPDARKIKIAVVVVLAALLALALPIPSSYSFAAGDQLAPILVGDTRGTPSDWMSSLIDCDGGLPRKPGRYAIDDSINPRKPACFAQSAAFPLELWQGSSWQLMRVTIDGYWGPLLQLLQYIPIPSIPQAY